jgi:hypothetical protein
MRCIWMQHSKKSAAICGAFTFDALRIAFRIFRFGMYLVINHEVHSRYSLSLRSAKRNCNFFLRRITKACKPLFFSRTFHAFLIDSIGLHGGRPPINACHTSFENGTLFDGAEHQAPANFRSEVNIGRSIS